MAIHTIVVTKHLDSNTKRSKVLLCYNFVNEITNEEEDMLFGGQTGFVYNRHNHLTKAKNLDDNV